MTDRFISPCPPPTAYEAELLAILIEECAEVQQRATKALRFGVAEVQPGQPLTNAQRIADEWGDLLATVELCRAAGLIDPSVVGPAVVRKREKLAKYLQTGTYRTAARGDQP